nr:DUF4368 domain-containing protein [uncultured Blautia sp.]
MSGYTDIRELDANLLKRLISKIVISELQEKDGTENYCSTPETFTMETSGVVRLISSKYFLIKDIKQLI